MKRNTLLLIALLATLIIAALVLLPKGNQQTDTVQRTDLPWLITPHADGTSTVLDLQLGHVSLEEAIKKLGTPEGIALFAKAGEPGELEVYFGTVNFGPLKAKVVVNLVATDEEKQAMLNRAVARQGASDRDICFTLAVEDQQRATTRKVKAITYIPIYSGLEADFFRKHLGEPAAWKVEDEGRVLWFYPDKGLTLLLDDDGKEIFQYDEPRAFQMPDGVEYSLPSTTH